MAPRVPSLRLADNPGRIAGEASHDQPDGERGYPWRGLVWQPIRGLALRFPHLQSRPAMALVPASCQHTQMNYGPEELAKACEGIFWFHSIDLGGFVTPGAKTPEIHAVECREILDPLDFRGRTVLDVGAWNGFYSFEAKRRGATRVVATDHYAWNTTRPELSGGRRSFDLCNSILGLNVEAIDIDIPALTCQAVDGPFDIVLFLGVFYHLVNPIDGLARVADLARHHLVVETHCDMLDVERPAMAYYPGIELGRDHTNWWGPNPACMVGLLRNCGFSNVTWQMSEAAPQRAVFHARRG
jgi:tRNA (mo5U34)-methyltransferase